MIYKRIKHILKQLEAWLPDIPSDIKWDSYAYRWKRYNNLQGRLIPIDRISFINPEDLQNIDNQKIIIDRNTRQFIQGKPANNILMTGARGTGKSSLVRSMLTNYCNHGLRIIEVFKSDLGDLPEIVEIIAHRPERYIIFCDDLSFQKEETDYRKFKSILDGSIFTKSDNVLIYATSNRRHLIPEYYSDNISNQLNEEIHFNESSEEKVSLSDRFGLWISFYPFGKDAYLNIVEYWLRKLGYSSNNIDIIYSESLQWALKRGSMSGRIAYQFALDWIARSN